MTYVLGVDGGGSKTFALVADDRGRLLGFGRGGPSNHESAGVNAAGRAPDGREVVFPALGWISGDWGGGGSLAMEMVRLVMRADDGRGPPTLLTPLLLGALGQPTAFELMRAL